MSMAELNLWIWDGMEWISLLLGQSSSSGFRIVNSLKASCSPDCLHSTTTLNQKRRNWSLFAIALRFGLAGSHPPSLRSRLLSRLLSDTSPENFLLTVYCGCVLLLSSFSLHSASACFLSDLRQAYSPSPSCPYRPTTPMGCVLDSLRLLGSRNFIFDQDLELLRSNSTLAMDIVLLQSDTRKPLPVGYSLAFAYSLAVPVQFFSAVASLIDQPDADVRLASIYLNGYSSPSVSL